MKCDNCQTEAKELREGKYYCPKCDVVFENTEAGTRAIDLDPLSAIKNKQGSFDERLTKLEKTKQAQAVDPDPDPQPVEENDDDEGSLTIEFGGSDDE